MVTESFSNRRDRREYNRARYPKIKEKVKAYKTANKEHIAAVKVAYRLKNKDAIKAYKDAYNPEYYLRRKGKLYTPRKVGELSVVALRNQLPEKGKYKRRKPTRGFDKAYMLSLIAALKKELGL